MAHFYIDESLSSTTVGEQVRLTGAEARHASSVSRVRIGEHVKIGNGRGLVLDVEASDVTKDTVEFRVLAVAKHEAPLVTVTLVQALTKGDRDERAIEAATELGVDHVIPWAAQRSVSEWKGEKATRGVERWSMIVREATKQSMRSFMPHVGEYATADALLSILSDDLIIVLDPEGDVDSEATWRALIVDAATLGRNVAIVVGPEGGITPSELDLFVSSGAVRVKLGRNILRSSTAGPAFLSAINGALQRW